MDIFDNEGVMIIPDSMKGVLSSLSKKGFIEVEAEDTKTFGSKSTDTPCQYIYLGDMFRDNQELLDEAIEKANESK